MTLTTRTGISILCTHTLDINPDLDEQALAQECLSHLKVLAESSTKNDMRVLEESTEVLGAEPDVKMRCSLRAVV